MTERVQMRPVDMTWSDRKPGYTGRLEGQGYRVVLGPGNYWTDAYHHIGREILSDAPKEVVIEAMMEATLVSMEAAGVRDSATVREIAEDLRQSVPEGVSTTTAGE